MSMAYVVMKVLVFCCSYSSVISVMELSCVFQCVNVLGSRSEVTEAMFEWQTSFRAVSSASRVTVICPEAIVTFAKVPRGQ